MAAGVWVRHALPIDARGERQLARARRPTRPALLAPVADGLDVVAVRVEDVGPVVVRVVHRAHARGAVVGRAGGEGGGVERVDVLAPLDPERDVEPALDGFAALRDPEER